MYRINPMITLTSATIELTTVQIAELVLAGQQIRNWFNGNPPSHLDPFLVLSDELAHVIRHEPEVAHA